MIENIMATSISVMIISISTYSYCYLFSDKNTRDKLIIALSFMAAVVLCVSFVWWFKDDITLQVEMSKKL